MGGGTGAGWRNGAIIGGIWARFSAKNPCETRNSLPLIEARIAIVVAIVVAVVVAVVVAGSQM